MGNTVNTAYPAGEGACTLVRETAAAGLPCRRTSGCCLHLAAVALWTWLAINPGLTSPIAQSWADHSSPAVQLWAQASPDSLNREWDDLLSAVRKSPEAEPAIPTPPDLSQSLRPPPAPQDVPAPEPPIEVDPAEPAQAEAASPQPASNPRGVPKQKPRRTEPVLLRTEGSVSQERREGRSFHRGTGSPARQAEQRQSRSKARPERPMQAASSAERNGEERSGLSARRAVEPKAASASPAVPSAETLEFPRSLIPAHAKD